MRLILLLVTGTFFLSAILTPWANSLLHLIVPNHPWPFSRVYDRVAMLVLIVLVVVFRKQFDLEMVRENLRSKSRIFPLVVGFSLTLGASLLVFAVLLTGSMFYLTERSISQALTKFVFIVASAVLISFLEETFFRGILFRKLYEKSSVVRAAILSSLTYAAVHFISPIKKFEVNGFDPLSGFVYTSKLFTRFLNPDALGAIFGLFLVGMLLCHVFYRVRNLYLCIGLHAGWVASVKLGLYFLSLRPGMNFPVGVGQRYFFISEPITWLSIVGVWGAFLLLNRYKLLNKNV